MKKENWKPIKGYKNLYQISDLGNIKSLPKYIGCVFSNGCILKIKPNRIGYIRVSLSDKHGDKKFFLVHRIVAKHFISLPPENKQFINHKNGIKTDNRVENLEWCNMSENIIHAIRNNLRQPIKGEKSNFSKLTEKEVLEIRSKAANKIPYKYLASMYNTSLSNIGHIVTRKNWAHI